jgi:hypothetical protein
MEWPEHLAGKVLRHMRDRAMFAARGRKAGRAVVPVAAVCRQAVCAVNHFILLSEFALLNRSDRKSFSRANRPIFACSAVRSGWSAARHVNCKLPTSLSLPFRDRVRMYIELLREAGWCAFICCQRHLCFNVIERAQIDRQYWQYPLPAQCEASGEHRRLVRSEAWRYCHAQGVDPVGDAGCGTPAVRRA